MAVIGFVAWRVWSNKAHPSMLIPTTAQIVSIMPCGELYVATSVIEDFTSEQATEYHFGLFPEEHTCALIMQQKVSYVIDMDSVKYDVQADGHILVTLPQPRFTASTRNIRFISDNEGFWRERKTDTSDMKTKVAEQIRYRFDTPEHRQQATLYAREAIAHILNQLNYEADFRPVVTERIGR